MIPASFALSDDSMAVMTHDNEINELNNYNDDLIGIGDANGIEVEEIDDDLIGIGDANDVDGEGIDDDLDANSQAFDAEERNVLENAEAELDSSHNSLGIAEEEKIDEGDSQKSGDIYTDYSDYINLKSELLTYDFNLSESNTIYECL